MKFRNIFITLFISIVVLVGCYTVLSTVYVPQYTNMTDVQAADQFSRFVNNEVKACYDAGGEWYVNAGCNVAYQEPDNSWYITPIINPMHETWEMISAILLGTGIIAAIVILWCIASFFVEWEYREVLRKYS